MREKIITSITELQRVMKIFLIIGPIYILFEYNRNLPSRQVFGLPPNLLDLTSPSNHRLIKFELEYGKARETLNAKTNNECIALLFFFMVFLMLYGVKKICLHPPNINDLPIAYTVPENCTFSKSFITAIADAKTLTDICEEISEEPFVTIETKKQKRESQKNIALIRSGKVYHAYFLENAKFYYRNKNELGEFIEPYGNKCSIYNKDDVIVVTREAFKEHLKKLHAQLQSTVVSRGLRHRLLKTPLPSKNKKNVVSQKRSKSVKLCPS